MKTGKERLLIVVVLLTLLAQLIFSLTKSRSYYTYEDVFGYLSKDFYIAISFFILHVALLLLLYALVKIHRENITLFPLILSLIGLISIYILPSISDAYYDQNFYDAGGHMIRGAYVTLTGHSDPQIDGYFDLQPGFFWATSIFINIVYGSPNTLWDPIFSFLVKWFHAIILSIYLPILMFFFKRMRLDLTSSSLALFLFLSLNMGKFHYAAQNYGNALYWLLLILLLDYREKTDHLILVLTAIVSTSIVVVHQGVAFFSLIAIISILMVNLIVISVSMRHLRRITYILFTFSIIWFMYLGYLSQWTLSDFVSVIHNVISRYLSEGALTVVSEGVYRPYDPWYKLVIFKSVYMLSLIALSIAILITMSRKERDLINKSVLAVYSVTTLVIGAVASALGGAGYIERVVVMLLPITVTSIAKVLKSLNRNMGASIALAMLTVLVLMGTLSYFSGRNFQSIPTSEDKAGAFLLTYSPNIEGLYLKRPVTNIFIPLLTNTTFMHGALYSLYNHDYIQTLYYYIGNVNKLNNYLSHVLK
ncbi:MAG: hypothetical protein ACP5GI_08515, partial [Sulfolobales archaeon]